MRTSASNCSTSHRCAVPAVAGSRSTLRDFDGFVPSRTLAPISFIIRRSGRQILPRVAYASPIASPRPEEVYGGSFATTRLRAMELTTILNRCHRFRGFVDEHARFSNGKKSIEVVLRPSQGSAAVCSRCHLPAPGYDQLAERCFEFIPLWGFFVFLLYAMRRVDYRRCGMVAVEEVPWGDGNAP